MQSLDRIGQQIGDGYDVQIGQRRSHAIGYRHRIGDDYFGDGRMSQQVWGFIGQNSVRGYNADIRVGTGGDKSLYGLLNRAAGGNNIVHNDGMLAAYVANNSGNLHFQRTGPPFVQNRNG